MFPRRKIIHKPPGVSRIGGGKLVVGFELARSLIHLWLKMQLTVVLSDGNWGHTGEHVRRGKKNSVIVKFFPKFDSTVSVARILSNNQTLNFQNYKILSLWIFPSEETDHRNISSWNVEIFSSTIFLHKVKMEHFLHV